jgi:hypothetical protein
VSEHDGVAPGVAAAAASLPLLRLRDSVQRIELSSSNSVFSGAV